MGTDISAHILQILASLVSLVACLWLLLCGLRSLRRSLRKQLFFQQIFGLALADVFFGVGSLAFTILSLSVSDSQLLCNYVFPSIYMFVQGFGEYASLLIGTQIGVAFAATSVRNGRVMRILECTRKLVWPFAMALALCDEALNPTLFDAQAQSCQSGSNYVFVCVGSICIIVTLACYIGVYCYMLLHEQPNAVVRRIWQRTSLYLVAMIVTVGPYLLSNAIGRRQMHGEESDVFALEHVSMALYCLNGLANVMIYAVQSRHFKHPLSTVQRKAAEELLQEAAATASADQTGRLAVEYSVYFLEQHSVVLFDASSYSTSPVPRDEHRSVEPAQDTEEAGKEPQAAGAAL
jgi:hypothetical protein